MSELVSYGWRLVWTEASRLQRGMEIVWLVITTIAPAAFKAWTAAMIAELSWLNIILITFFGASSIVAFAAFRRAWHFDHPAFSLKPELDPKNNLIRVKVSGQPKKDGLKVIVRIRKLGDASSIIGQALQPGKSQPQDGAKIDVFQSGSYVGFAFMQNNDGRIWIDRWRDSDRTGAFGIPASDLDVELEAIAEDGVTATTRFKFGVENNKLVLHES